MSSSDGTVQCRVSGIVSAVDQGVATYRRRAPSLRELTLAGQTFKSVALGSPQSRVVCLGDRQDTR